MLDAKEVYAGRLFGVLKGIKLAGRLGAVFDAVALPEGLVEQVLDVSWIW